MLVSDSTANRSFARVINQKINNDIYHSTEADWIQFLQDHRSLLIANSTEVQLTEAVMNRYQYCIRSYLREEHHVNESVDQAFRIVNKLHNEMEFTLALGSVYVPKVDYVNNLHNIFRTAQAQIANSERY